MKNKGDTPMQKELNVCGLDQDSSQNSFVYSEVSHLYGTGDTVLTTMKSSSNYFNYFYTESYMLPDKRIK